MQRRWIVGLVLAGAAAAAFFVLRGDDDAPAATAEKTARDAPPPVRRAARQAPDRQAPPERDHQGGVPPQGLADVSPSVKKWTVPGQNGWFREIVAPDDSLNVEERLLYRTRRLRFRLADAAAACYDGPDGKEHIVLSYELVVDGGQMRVENVQVVENHLTDPNLRDCILEAVRTSTSAAPDVPAMRKKQKTSIGIHDLYVRNRTAE